MDVRVRFELPAVGRLNVISARTALYGWLYARHEGGRYILRGARDSTPLISASLLDELCFLGLDWEGETERKAGRRAPYQEIVRRLLEDGRASGSRRDLGLSTGICLHYPREGQTSFVDRVFHDQAVDRASLGGIGLLTAKGQPTALLRRVVDDRRAAITHVLRDARRLPEAPRELLLYRALGWEPPAYAHLPPIIGPGAETEIQALARLGYSGPAVANLLARLGWTPRGKRALLTLDELAARFDLDRVSHRPVTFDRRLLDWFNRRWVGGLGVDQVSGLFVPHWQSAYGRGDRAEGTALSSQAWRQTLALAIREEVSRPAEAVAKARFAFADELDLDPASQAALDEPYAPQVLEAFARELPFVVPYEFDRLDAFCRDLRLRFKSKLGIRSRDVMYLLRAALTGQQSGPCLVVVCQLLGPGRCIQRVERLLAKKE